MNKLLAIPKLFVALIAAAALLMVAVLPFAGAAGWAVNAASNTMNSNLEDIDSHASLPLISTMTDRDGNVLAHFYNQHRIQVPSEAISQDIKDSIVAIEDRRFYEHTGVDLRGALRAMISNINAGGVSEGASTITQQYVKNYLFYIAADSVDDQAAAVETSIPRKLREMRMAAELDKNLSKDEILTRYLNLIAYGNGAYGVEAAARTYFGVSAAELNATQSAFLAGVVQSTSLLDPYTNPEGALERRNAVLQARADMGTLPQELVDQLVQEPLGVLPEPQIPQAGCIAAGNNGFFCDYALQWLADHGLSESQLLQGGYTIRTTLNPAVQATALETTRAHVDPLAEGVAAVSSFVVPSFAPELTASEDTATGATGGSNGTEGTAGAGTSETETTADSVTLPTWSTSTGHEVIALAASRTYGLNEAEKQTVFPITHTLQGHGAGSVFKIFATAAALERGLGIDSEIAVPRRVEITGMGTGGARGCPADTYCVENAADFQDRMTLQAAMATSPNTPFVEIAQTVGMQRIMDISVDLGLRSYTQPGTFSEDLSIEEQVLSDNSASYVLGPMAVNPVELSNVAATLADGGRWCEPTPILNVTDRHGQDVTLNRTPCEQVLRQDVAQAVAHAMGSDVTTGTAAEAAAAHRWNAPFSAKSGTTETNLSAAFLGFAPGWAGSTYIFNDAGSPQSLCSGPVRKCGTQGGTLFGGSEPASMLFATTAQHIDQFGGPGLPPLNERFKQGVDPEGYRAAFDDRAANRPSIAAPSLTVAELGPDGDRIAQERNAEDADANATEANADTQDSVSEDNANGSANPAIPNDAGSPQQTNADWIPNQPQTPQPNALGHVAGMYWPDAGIYFDGTYYYDSNGAYYYDPVAQDYFYVD